MKKSLILALALLTLVGCETKKDDAKEVKESKQEIKESKAGEKELSYSEQIAKNLEENKKKREKELAETTINNPTIDEIINKDSSVDVENLSDKLLLNALKNPNSLYEQYLSDNITWYDVPDDSVIDAMRTNVSSDFEYANSLGINLNSLPIYMAIYQESGIVAGDVMERGEASAMYGFDINGITIDDFNAFLDPSIAQNYRLMLSTYELRDYVVSCYSQSVGIGKPLAKWFLSYSGSVDNILRTEDYPGGITATTLITTSYDPYPCYVTIVYKTDEPINIGNSLSQIWTMPLNLFTLDASTQNRIDMLPVPHMITGPGFMYLS